jgi:hypothetical protein
MTSVIRLDSEHLHWIVINTLAISSVQVHALDIDQGVRIVEQKMTSITSRLFWK